MRTIWGYDIGGNATKALKFGGSEQGELWYADGPPNSTPSAETPRNVPAGEFMARLGASLERTGLGAGPDDLTGYSICGPVVKDTCLRLMNLGVHEPFQVNGDAVANDGIAATIGSLIAGAARGHRGGLALFTLGTGIGFGSLHWDEHGRRVTNDGEIHFTVRGSDRVCNCHRRGCFEAAANEAALATYARDAGLDPVTADPHKTDIGREFERVLQDHSLPGHEPVRRAVELWHTFLAQGIANVFSLLNLGGNALQPPVLFVLAGGLSALVDEQRLRTLVLAEFGNDPFLGTNFLVRKETILGNRAGAIGAAALALANDSGWLVTDIRFRDTTPEHAT